MRRVFCEQKITTDQITLAGSEAHHLTNVLHVQAGEEVTLFDNTGWEFLAQVVKATKREVHFAVQERSEIDRVAPRSLTLAVALPKGDRQRVLVEKATELGVTTLRPMLTERSVVKPRDNSLEKMRRYVVEASKQCGRNRLMEIAKPIALAELLERPTKGTKLISHPNGAPLRDFLTPDCTEILALVGPEGGFADTEVTQAVAAGFSQVSLATTILRIETAALTIAATNLNL